MQQIVPGGDAMVGTEDPHGFGRGDGLRQTSRLELHTDQTAQLAWLRGWVDSSHPQRAASGWAQALQTLESAGLASAIRSKQAEDLTRLDLERNPIDCHNVAV